MVPEVLLLNSSGVVVHLLLQVDPLSVSYELFIGLLDHMVG